MRGGPPALRVALATSSAVTAWLIWGLHALPWLAWLLSITAVTLLVFGWDKWAARANRRRVAEFDLLMLVLVGGTVGALVAMPLFRHKTIKTAFRRRFWLVIMLQALLLSAWLLRGRFLPQSSTPGAASPAVTATAAKTRPSVIRNATPGLFAGRPVRARSQVRPWSYEM
ncbi:MAG: DUF1294 domain-containing protein [Verrucomicrobiales bacterium]|nr:DUF1294 domain-containing protein [Verrucomicrobiales bacterium]MCP5526434.1 DUF1294 domain-containing protein [Verrucomicrobiales bacterium]